MFTIDLLKGQGIPIKSRPGGMAISGVSIAVPLIIATIMFSSYVRNRIIISIQKRGITSFKTRTEKLSDVINQHKSLEKEKSLYNSCLSELRSSISRHTQWSPILVTIVQNVPDQVILTGLEVKRRFIRRKIPQTCGELAESKDDSKKQVEGPRSAGTHINVPVSTLTLTVVAVPQSDCDQAVRDFRQRLLNSDLLGPKLENINVSQDSDTFDGQNVVSYQIDCLFKPAL